jgi:CelD/BcsL family acetyltransferase involved in cellulose biosynthesis
LTPEEVHAWSDLQRADPTLESPFFRPEFTQAVAAVRADVEVAILEEAGQPVGFFPFQRGRWRAGRPVGGRMSDYQGLIARQGLAWSAEELLRSCRLSAWDFDHLVTSQEVFRPYHFTLGGSPYADLSRGFDAFVTARREEGVRTINRVKRLRRKLEREKGDVRLAFHTNDRGVFEALLAWKSTQYRRTRVTDVFAFSWTVQLLERVLAVKDEAFRGILTALYVRDRLVAIEMSLCSHDVIHSWFPAYDHEFARYSPGLVLQLELLREAATGGFRRYDMGKGSAQYKDSFASGVVPLAEGSVALGSLGSLRRLARRAWYQTRTWARTSPLGAPMRLAGRLTRSLRGWLAFR